MRLLPQLDIISSDDELREAMNHIFYNGRKRELAATDAHILSIVRVEQYKGIELGSKSFLVHREDFKKLNAARAKRIEYSDGVLRTFDKDGKILHKAEVRTDLTYPAYEAVIPDMENRAELGVIGVNLSLMGKLHKALMVEGKDAMPGCRVTLFGETKAIVCQPMDRLQELNLGLVMPVMLKL